MASVPSRTMTMRPASSGRPSSQYTWPPSAMAWLRLTAASTSAAEEIGDGQVPYGRVVSLTRATRANRRRVVHRHLAHVVAGVRGGNDVAAADVDADVVDVAVIE